MSLLPKKQFIEDPKELYSTARTHAFQGFEIDDVLFEQETPYQKISIYSNDALGKVMTLDGLIQITTADEFIYQEMMAHVPILSHSNAKNVLIIGGGDGGILREVLKHPFVEKIVMVEIDQVVVDSCIKYLPEINNNGDVYSDERTNLVIQDAAKYIKENTSLLFDIIIIDSTDPVGPGEKLFTKEFYKDLHKVMNDECITVSQGGLPFFCAEDLLNTLKSLSDLGLTTSCYITSIPTYYGGYMTLGFSTNSKNTLPPSLNTLKERYVRSDIKTKHYTPEIHRASFVLPPWIQSKYLDI